MMLGATRAAAMLFWRPPRSRRWNVRSSLTTSEMSFHMSGNRPCSIVAGSAREEPTA